MLTRCIQCLHSQLRARNITPILNSTCFSSRHNIPEGFDLSELVRQNKGEKTRKSAKRSSTKKKTKTSEEDVLSTPHSQQEPQIPECFSFILDMPLYSGVDVDLARETEFKSVIDELGLGRLPSVSRVISDTQSHAQKAVLARWEREKTKELGGVDQFMAYKQGLQNNNNKL